MGTRRQEVLKRLLSNPRRHLIKIQTDGSRELTKLFHLLDLTPDSTQPDAKSDLKVQLHAVFDFLLDEGYPSYVSDYVDEVCRDPRMTSSNPVEAYILDGTAVLDWCMSVISSIRNMVANDFLALKERRILCKCAAKAEGLCTILAALSSISGSEEGVVEAMDAAAQFKQGFQVMQWCSSFSWVDQEPSGPFSTNYGDWHRSLQESARYDDLFCSMMSKEVDVSGYPFGSVMHAVQKLFFPQQTLGSDSAVKTRIHLLGYFLMDAGYLKDLEAFADAPFDLELSETKLIEGKIFFDRHRYKSNDENALETAMSKFKLAMPSVPFSIVDILVRFEYPKCALDIWNGQRKYWQNLNVEDFKVVTQAFLLSRGPALALDAIRKFTKDLPAPERAKALTALVGDILDWGLESSEMERIINLPLLKEEEEVYVAWAKEHWDNDQCNAYFPLFYIVRSRMLEAIKLVTLAELERKIEKEQVSIWQRVINLVKDARRDLPDSIRETLSRLTPGSVTNSLGVRSDDLDEHDGTDSICSQRSSWPSQHCTRVVGSPLNENTPSALETSESNRRNSSGPSSSECPIVRSRNRKRSECLSSSCAEAYSATKRRRSSLPASIDAITGMR